MKLRLPTTIGARVAAGLLVLCAVALGGAFVTYSEMNTQADRIARIGRAAEGPVLVERLRAGVLAAVMESRGLYLARDAQQAEHFANNLTASLAEMDAVWHRVLQVVPPQQHEGAASLDRSVAEFVKMRTELARVGVQQGAAAANKLGNNDANRTTREAFSRGLDWLAQATSATVDGLKAEAVAAGRRAALALLAATALAVVVTLGLVLWLTHLTIARPLRHVTRALEAIAEGTLDGIVLPPAGGGEVGDIARATTVVLARLRRNRQVEMAAAAEHEAQGRRQQMMDQDTKVFSQSVSEVMDQLAASAAAMRQTANEMAQAIEKTNDGAATTVAGAEQSAADLAAVAKTTADLTASVSAITQEVAAAAAAARGAVARSEETTRIVQGLTEAAQMIGHVVRVIAGVAGQTNLLALNATIEAARAGEAGAGFAVVASEVKQLAQETAKATEGIATQVTAIQSTTTTALGAMRGVGDAILSIDQASAAIAAAIEKQGAAAEAIAANVQDVAVRNDTATRAMRQVATIAENANACTAAALAAADNVAQVAGRMRHEVTAFLHAMQRHETERRRNDRIPGCGVMVLLHIAGQPATTVELVDVSRSGAALACDFPFDTGSEVTLILPDTQPAVAAQVTRAEGGIVAIKFRQTAENLATLEAGISAIHHRKALVAAA